MKTGDVVQVTNLDGETSEGTIVSIMATKANEYTNPDYLPDGATLADYWRGADIDPEAPVVKVSLDGQVYDYPADRVEVLE